MPGRGPLPFLDKTVQQMLSADHMRLGVEPSSVAGLRLQTIIQRLQTIERMHENNGGYSTFWSLIVPELADIEKAARQARLAIERALGTVED